MDVTGVRVRMQAPEQDVLVLLAEEEGTRSLPIVIGPHEGVAIATARAGMRPQRPGTHDLLLNTMEACGVSLKQVDIVELSDGTFIAELVLSTGIRVDSRASDAIAVALRADVDIWCTEEILDEAGVILSTDEDGSVRVQLDGPASEAEAEEEVAYFRQFLDSVEADDFGPDEGNE